MRERHRELAGANPNALKLLDQLFRMPVVSIHDAEQQLGCSFVTASSAIGALQESGLVREITGKSRNRLFRYEPNLDLFRHLRLEPETEPLK